MPRPVDLDELIDAGEVAQLLGLSSRTSVATYRKRYEDFPGPVLERPNCAHWLRPEVLAWAAARPQTR